MAQMTPSFPAGSAAFAREQLGKVLLGVLLTGLGRLPDLLADRLPLVVLVVLDRVHECLAVVLGKLGIVHVLVPVLLDTAFRSRGECL